MTGKVLRNVLGALCAFAALFAAPQVAQARLQCVAFARSNSDVQLSGNARDWWANAAGSYSRGQTPRAGSVHVAVVSKVVDERHVLLNHANWSAPGMVEKGVMAVDVSAAGDWSEVRVWYGKTKSLGLRPSPAFGFIYPTSNLAAADSAKAPAAL